MGQGASYSSPRGLCSDCLGRKLHSWDLDPHSKLGKLHYSRTQASEAHGREHGAEKVLYPWATHPDRAWPGRCFQASALVIPTTPSEGGPQITPASIEQTETQVQSIPRVCQEVASPLGLDVKHTLRTAVSPPAMWWQASCRYTGMWA